MASIFSSITSLFGGSGKQSSGNEDAKASAGEEKQAYGECIIFATPMKEGNQFRLAGRIEKEVNGETLIRTFIRADVFTARDDAIETTFRKGHQIVDQNGSSLFGDGEKSRQV